MLKRIWNIFVVGAIATSLLMGTAMAPAMANTDEIDDIAVQAYIYAYPLLLMEATRQAEIADGVPMNQFKHKEEFPDAKFKDVVRPNVDTLYSTAWLDLSCEPIVLSVPEIEDDRYYLMPIMDMWTDVVAAPGTRTTGNSAANFAIIGPDWEGRLPSDLEPIPFTTNMGWIIGRTETKGEGDYDDVHDIQKQYKLTPLSQWGKQHKRTRLHKGGQHYKPQLKARPNFREDMTPPEQVAAMNAEEYFEQFAELLQHNRPHTIDWNIVQQLEQIGIVVGSDLDFSKLPEEIKSQLEIAVDEANNLIADQSFGETVNGWEISREFMGIYGTSYLHRASVARKGLGANLPEDAIYPKSSLYKGLIKYIKYQGKNNYVLHFDEEPPVNAFWSLTMYNSEGYFVPNESNRYAISSWDKNLQKGDDGSLDIYIQHNSPGESKEDNWLPAPAPDDNQDGDDEFNLLLRLYWPGQEIITGEWDPPAVKLVRRGKSSDDVSIDQSEQFPPEPSEDMSDSELWNRIIQEVIR